MSHDYLFVYGTLRKGAANSTHGLLAPHGRFVAFATYQGKLYRVVDEYPGAIPSSDPKDIVHGEVYCLSRPEVAFAHLDAYEKCGPGFPQPAEYVRRRAEVTLDNGKAVSAWLYVYNRPTEGLVLIEDGDFLGKRIP